MTQLVGFLRGVDLGLFHRINQVWTHPWLDAFFPWLTDLDRNAIAVWGALPVALAWWLYVQRGRAVKALLAMVVAVGVSDAVAHRFIKPYVHRDRPTSAGVSVTLRTHRPGSYGFPSNHACNTFAGATVLGMAEPPMLWPALAVAALVAYSRVYAGVHFPADVAAGALLGLLVGGAVGAGLLRFGGSARSARSKKKG
ncbi:MAG: phosphatase PAP2 family protein [Elusimicrobia bacterium]|nr:phosphatase PAP2 family protein [Elusimicrobiota bacterium]